MATCHEKSRLLLSFFPFFSRAHTRKSQWVVTVTKYRSAIAAAAAHYIHTLLHTMLHIYSVLMLTKQEDSLLIIISRLRGSLIISRLSPRTKACFDWIDDSGSEQSESSINSDHARLVTAAAVITEFYARVVCVRCAAMPSLRCLLTSNMIWIISSIIRKIGYEMRASAVIHVTLATSNQPSTTMQWNTR